MTFRKLALAAALSLTASVAAHAQAVVTPLAGPAPAFGAPQFDGIEGRSVYRVQPTEPNAFFNESDERGGRNYGDRENPQLGE